MIFDFSFKTGANFLQSYSRNDDTNIAANFGGSLSLSSKLISGINYSRLSANGQTLVEQNAYIYDEEEVPPNYVNSGDYYFRTGETFKNVSFNQNLNVAALSAYSFLYNIKDDHREAPVGTGVSATTKNSEIATQLAARYQDKTGSFAGMDSFDYFLNGQKIYSGISGSYHISGAGFNFSLLDTADGKVFAIPKNTGIYNTTGITPDIFGTGFVERTVFAYANGLCLHPDNWLELHTGVTLIETGIQARLFDASIDTKSFSL
jgi:hypothetical protein